MNRGYTYFDRITRDHEGWTGLEYYTLRHPHFSEAQWIARFREGRITREGVVLQPEDRVHAGQMLAYKREPWEEPEVPDQIPILFRNDHVMVFDKPNGMPVLPGGRYLEHSLVMTLRRIYGDQLSPVHRLGRGTTGALLFSCSIPGASAFNLMMRQRRIQKDYLALVHGWNLHDHVIIDTPIGRVPFPRLGSIHDVCLDGKPAVSICTTLARHKPSDSALVQVHIPTGRTHQIRIHLASIGHPLLGDAFYRGPEKSCADDALPGDSGYVLHSWKIGFRDPFSEGDVEIIAPVRPEIVQWCRVLEREGASEVANLCSLGIIPGPQI